MLEMDVGLRHCLVLRNKIKDLEIVKWCRSVPTRQALNGKMETKKPQHMIEIESQLQNME
jgi:hypothetical protein